MPPPELAGNAPRLDVLQPVEIGLFPVFRHEFRAPVPHRLQRRFGERFRIHEPLVGQHRLDHHFRAVAEGLHHLVALDQRHDLRRRVLIRRRLAAKARVVGAAHDGEALGGDRIDHQLARLIPVQPAIFVGDEVDRVHLVLGEFLAVNDGLRLRRLLRVRRAVGPHRGLRVHQAIAGNAPAFRHRVVVEVMRAGDLHRARSEIRVRVFVGDDRDQAAMLLRADGNFAELADDGRIALVIGMHRDRAVAEHGFGPRGGDGDVVARLAKRDVPVLVLFHIFVSRAARERVFEVPHMAVDFGVLDLQIRNRGLELRVPVHQPLAAIDQALIVEIDEDLEDGVVEVSLLPLRRAGRPGHGKGVARPVAGGAEAL